MIWLGPAPLVGSTEVQGDVTASGSSLGCEGFELHIGQPNPGICLAGLKTSGAYLTERSVRNLDTALKEYTHLLTYNHNTDTCVSESNSRAGIATTGTLVPVHTGRGSEASSAI